MFCKFASRDVYFQNNNPPIIFEKWGESRGGRGDLKYLLDKYEMAEDYIF